MILQTLCSFAACFFYAITVHAPKKELCYCGLAGGLSWFFYVFSNQILDNTVWASFIATACVTACARFLSHFRYAPSTLYLLPGILPLVPGAGMYNTMFGILNGDMVYSYTEGVKTLKVAGVIAIGIISVLSLPYSAFSFIRPRDSKKTKK